MPVSGDGDFGKIVVEKGDGKGVRAIGQHLIFLSERNIQHIDFDEPVGTSPLGILIEDRIQHRMVDAFNVIAVADINDIVCRKWDVRVIF